jgi:hypothetical protein
MEKRLCLTSFWFGLPVCGMDVMRLLKEFTPFYDFFPGLRLSKKTFVALLLLAWLTC